MQHSHLRAAMAVALAALFCDGALAQGQGLRLQRSTASPPGTGEDLPAFVIADRLEGVPDREVDAIGNAELRKGTTSLTADRIRFFVPEDEAEATGNVHLNVNGDQISGPRLRLRVGDTTGVFDLPSFNLAPREFNRTRPTESRGEAKALRFDGEERYRITDGRFTTCKPGQDDWFVRAAELDLDFQREVGTARGGSLEFMGVSTPTLPWFDFSLNNERKSGFLPPTFGVQTKNGFEFTAPFYWNIAPNYDATLTPRYMQQRGLQGIASGRYLNPRYQGIASIEGLNDHEADEFRWAYAWQHWYSNPSAGLSGLININRVSDDSYFRDLSGRLSIATQQFLPREGQLTYSSTTGGLWSVTGRVQKFQTLQDPGAPVVPPYNRVPQVTANYLKPIIGGVDVGLQGEFVAFDTTVSQLPTGRRGIIYPSLALPLVRPGAYITPKIGVNSTIYNLSDLNDPTAPRTPTRNLTIASVDSGLFFERDAHYFDRDWVQTLEPRIYYLYVPYKDQSKIPLFDTSQADFSYAQIFSENYYNGSDRISNANQVTLALTSRLILPSTGQEILRGLIGQQYYFMNQRVPLVGSEPLTINTTSPLLASVAGRISQNWTAEATVQYAFQDNTVDNGLQRANIGMRYSPEIAKVINLGYRYTGAGVSGTGTEIRQADVSGQWPVGGGWYLIGRYNYDFVGKQANEALAGVEYNAGCWIIRLVAQSFVTGSESRTNLFFVQLELNGFSRFGSNPLEAVRRNIPGYQPLNRPVVPGVRAFDLDPMGTVVPDLGASSPMPYGGTGSVPYDN